MEVAEVNQEGRMNRHGAWSTQGCTITSYDKYNNVHNTYEMLRDSSLYFGNVNDFTQCGPMKIKMSD